jgi:hypothetical protein
MSSFDAIIVPGGGLRADGTLPEYAATRFDRALALASPATHIVTLSAGTLHKPPPRDPSGAPVFESIAGARYLLERGFPADRILTETASWDTIGNAYFCRVIHTDPRRFARLLIITSAFHMPRTEAIFRWVYALEPLAVAYELAFESTPDDGIDAESLAARYARERRSLTELVPATQRYRTLADFHSWLFVEHGFYAAGLRDVRSDAPPPDVLTTY